ncbi:MAG: RNA pseudouridine synthase, partial [Flavobacteriaceae bacterium]|nr:RNA pseudouridine synthase [Flavobacteriaceae bacterium]
MSFKQKDILFEDNHLIVVNKMSGVLVQKDKTGDKSLSDHIKSYIKVKNKKPGNVFLGVVHRIDRPTSGVIVFAKTSKALSRLNKQFVDRKVNKKYLAITNNINCLSSDKLKNWIIKNTKQNKSYIHSSPIPGSKIAILRYSLIKELNNYSLLEVIIETGRHHQIRAQLS